MQILGAVFLGRLISRFGQITWPTCSLDRAVPVYVLCGYVKNKVYETRPANIADLKPNFGVCSRYPQGNATTCCDSLSIATAGVY